MIASPTSPALSSLQTAVASDTQVAEQSNVTARLVSQAAVDEFTVRFSAALLAVLANEGVSPASPVSKRLKAYAGTKVPTVSSTSRFV